MKIKKAAILVILISNLIYNNADCQISKVDKQLIENHIAQLNRELFLDLYKDSLITKKKYSHEFVDSVLHEYRTSYDDGHVTYAPDKKFKIFVLEGESCGAHCSNFYSAFIHLNNTISAIYKIDFLPVTHVYKLKDNKYLVLQKAVIGGGNIFDNCMQATLIAVKGNTVMRYPIRYPKAKDTKSGSLYLWQSNRFDESSSNTPDLTFNQKTKKLTYKFIRAEDSVVSDNSVNVYAYSGYFSYKNGAFIFQKETKSKLK